MKATATRRSPETLVRAVRDDGPFIRIWDFGFGAKRPMWPFTKKTDDDGSRRPGRGESQEAQEAQPTAGAGVVVAKEPVQLICVPAIALDVPRPRSLLWACDYCGRPVWVHLKVLLALPADVHVELWCGPCRLREVVRSICGARQ